MAVHVPFSQRPSGRHQGQPIYIGFEPARPARPKFNWWGFNGLFFFFLSLGLLSPITLLLSLVGLKQKPRKMAVTGTLLSMIGVVVMSAVAVNVAHEAERARMRRHDAYIASVNAEKIEETQVMLAMAAEEFEEYRDNHDGNLPSDMDGSALAIKHVDQWGEEVMYDVSRDAVALRSSGPDKDFFTRDDVTHQINGETETEALLPIDAE